MRYLSSIMKYIFGIFLLYVVVCFWTMVFDIVSAMHHAEAVSGWLFFLSNGIWCLFSLWLIFRMEVHIKYKRIMCERIWALEREFARQQKIIESQTLRLFIYKNMIDSFRFLRRK